MTEIENRKNNQNITLIDVMISLTILSILFLPCFMFLNEYSKGGLETKDKFDILYLVENKLENLLSLPFNDIPVGKNSDIIIHSKNGKEIDLKPILHSNKKISFYLNVEVLPVSFSAIKNYSTRQIEKVTVENGMKKIIITAKCGNEDNSQNIKLIAYKANR